MARVIITGGTGFVGANLARRLLHEGHEVNLLVRQGYTSWRINDIGSDLRLHTVDLGDRDSVIRIAGKIRPDWVFHLAAHGGTALHKTTAIRWSRRMSSGLSIWSRHVSMSGFRRS